MHDVAVDPVHLVESMGHGMAVVDLEGNVSWANAAADRITGFRRLADPEDWSPHREWTCVRADGTLLPPNERPASIAIRTGRPVHHRIVGFQEPGSGAICWIQASAVPHRDDHHRITGAIVTFEDITAVFCRAQDRRERERHRAGQADRGRRALRALEAAVLPRALPEVPGLGLAARYLPAASASALGGDWYDAIPLPDGQLLVSVGDVAGHGLEAIAFMNVLRNAVRLLAALDPDPGAVVQGLRRLVAANHPGEFATVAVARYEPDSGRLHCVTAGHLPPLVRRSGGRIETLMARASGPPLGAPAAGSGRSEHTVLAPGDALVLFTDGLIERRCEALDLGYRRLARRLARPVTDAEQLADAAVSRLHRSGHEDDVCVLVVHRHADGRPDADVSPHPGAATER